MHYSPDRSTANSVSFSLLAQLSFICRLARTNLFNIKRSEICSSRSTFSHLICDIVRIGTEPEVRDADAWGIVAAMQNAETDWDIAFGELPGDTMRSDISASNHKEAVAIFVFRADPFLAPIAVFGRDMATESLSYWGDRASLANPVAVPAAILGASDPIWLDRKRPFARFANGGRLTLHDVLLMRCATGLASCTRAALHHYFTTLVMPDGVTAVTL